MTTNNSKAPMIVVTGASGTVGSAVVAAVKARGHAPRLAFHSNAKAEAARSAGDAAVVMDYTRPETLGPALAGADAVFLLATGGIGQAEAEINVVNAARAAGVRRIVKLSVWRAGDAGYAMAGIHRTVERAIEESGLGWTFLRATGFMQNFVTHLGGSIRATGRIFQPAGDARLSHIDVRDIAAVAAEVLTTDSHAGKIYELSGPEALSYGDAAAILSRVLDKRLEYVAVTDDAARATLLSAGVPAAYADMVIDLYRYYRTGAVATVSTAVKDITGRDPIRFEQFARDHLSAFVG